MAAPYSISLSLNAAKALADMPIAQRQDIDRQLCQIAELASVAPPSRLWGRSFTESQPLRLVVGEVTVRYVVSDESRTITVTELARA